MKTASNNDLKLLRKLNRKKYREKEQAFLVEGERAVEQVLANGFVEVLDVFVQKAQEARFEAQDKSIEFKSVEDSVFEEVADTENTQGIMAVCRMPKAPELQEVAGMEGLILATDAIQDPGNMGTIIRTAAWFGVKAILVGKGSVDVYHPKVVRSTAGATGSLPVIPGGLEELLPELESSGWKVLLLDGGSEAKSLKEIQPGEKTIIVVGNEGNGISEGLFLSSRQKVKIEAHSENQPVESLNAAIAVSIALYSVSS